MLTEDLLNKTKGIEISSKEDIVNLMNSLYRLLDEYHATELEKCSRTKKEIKSIIDYCTKN